MLVFNSFKKHIVLRALVIILQQPFLLLDITTVKTIDLVLTDQQSVWKAILHLLDTVNTKKRWKTIYWHVNNFWKLTTLMTFNFLERLTVLSLWFYSISGNANSMVKPLLTLNKWSKDTISYALWRKKMVISF
jgi:hypothetical protein